MNWTKPSRAAAALAAVVFLAAGVLMLVTHTGSGPARPASPVVRPPSLAQPVPVTVPAIDVSGIRWADYQGYRLPVTSSDGPRDTGGGLASGFSDTPLGALLAAINIGARTAWQFGPAVFQPTIQWQVTGPYQSLMLSGDTDAYAAGAAQIPDIAARAVIVAWQYVSYTPADATVDIIAEGPGETSTTTLVATQIQAEWIGGDWRLVAPPGGDWGNSAAQVPSLNGYLTFPGQG